MSSPYLQGEALAAAVADGAAPLTSRFGAAPAIAVVLGSGWSGASESLRDAQRMPYTELPGWPLPRVQGHVNELVVGATAAGTRVALIANPPRSAALNEARAPLILPMGVRAPATMYEPDMGGPLECRAVGRRVPGGWERAPAYSAPPSTGEPAPFVRRCSVPPMPT